MSGFENYRGELEEIDREIQHFAAVCGIALNDSAALRSCLQAEHAEWADDRARASLRGLLALRLKVETKMLEEGLEPPELGACPAAVAGGSAAAGNAA